MISFRFPLTMSSFPFRKLRISQHMHSVLTLTDNPKSIRNRFVIEVFGGVFVLSRCFLDFSVGVGASS